MAKNDSNKISRRIVHLRDFADDAAKLKKNYGKTNRFQIGIDSLDRYLGGGIGRHDGYEIVVLFGPTGIGKSLIGLNFLKNPVQKGERVGIMALEDDGPDVFIRFTDILGEDLTKKYVMSGDTIHMMPEEALQRSWQLDDLLNLLEEWFTDRNLDLILLDHLQFAFEGAESLRGENEWIAQRIFMQKLNQMMKRVNKTIIIINHVSKDARARGLNKIVGSSSIAQAGTKVIEVNKASDKTSLRLWKSRFTVTPDDEILLTMKGTKLEDDGVVQIPF